MAKKPRVMYIPGKSGGKGNIVVRDKKGNVFIKIPTRPTFDPGTIFFDAHCCKLDFSDCVLRKAGENCANNADRPVTSWY